MTLDMTSSGRFGGQICQYLALAAIGLLLGVYLFFQNPWMQPDLYSNSYSWFLDFAHTIFHKQSAYYAESILFPLIAKLTGQTYSLLSYKLLGAFLILSILPIAAILAQYYFRNFYQALIFIILFGATFQYLRFYILGYPDPLTILLLLTTVFQRRLGIIFILLTLAMLSHFSMAAIAVISLIGLVIFAPFHSFGRVGSLLGVMIASIVAGKILLLSWYRLFHYQLTSRLDWVIEHGHVFFLERYNADISGFWLMLGAPFLILYALMLILFVIQRNYGFVFAAVFALGLAYSALFWTVDGLRIFAVIIVAPYTFILIQFIKSFDRYFLKRQIFNSVRA